MYVYIYMYRNNVYNIYSFFVIENDVEKIFKFRCFLLRLSIVNKLLSPHNLQPLHQVCKQLNKMVFFYIQNISVKYFFYQYLSANISNTVLVKFPFFKA